MTQGALLRAAHLAGVTYEIRGPLAKRALEIEAEGHPVVKLNIGNPAAFGFRMPEALRAAIVDNLARAEGYTHQKGYLEARELVASAARARGSSDVTADDVFLGNGVSELILMCLEALCEPGDEVLVPAPDYPLWTAAVRLTGARAVHYPCRPERGFVPDVAEVASLAGPRTRRDRDHQPEQPDGRRVPARRDRRPRRARPGARGWVVFSDEIYDRLLYDGAAHVPVASACGEALCATFGGLSKVHRACGIRSGWVAWTGDRERARDYLDALELLASLRLCPNAPAQWAIAAALGGATPSAEELTAGDGRLGRQRRALVDGVARSRFLSLDPAPRGALYGFVRVDAARLPGFDDARFAMELLERERVLVVPGSSFHVDYKDHLRVTFLPDEQVLTDVIARMDRLLAAWPAGG